MNAADLFYDMPLTTLTATNVNTGATAWTFNQAPNPVDPTLDSAPIVAGGTVIVGGSSGNIFGLASTDGRQLWKISAGSGMGIAAPDEQNVSQPLTGLASWSRDVEENGRRRTSCSST